MNHRLVLFVGEHWPAEPALPWVLLDADRKLVEEGHTEPRHWPAAASVEAVLAAHLVSWTRVELPPGKRRDETRLLAYALEDRLVADPDSQHLTVTRRRPRNDGVSCDVLVVARARLRALLAQLEAIGRAPQRVVAAPECIPASAREWVLACEPGDGMFLRLDEAGLLPVDRASYPLVLARVLERARAENAPPETLIRLMAGEQSELTLDASAMPLTRGERWAWWERIAQATNLLHGEFSPHGRGAGALQAVRGPLRLAAASLALLAVATIGEVLVKRAHLADLDARMLRLFQTAQPGTPAIDPARQLARSLDALRAQQGELRENDLLSLVAAYLAAAGTTGTASIQTLEYATADAGGPRLTLTLAQNDPQNIAVVRERLHAQGLRVLPGNVPASLVIASGARP